MDIARPDRKRQRQRRRFLMIIVGLMAITLVTWGVSNLEPAAREVDRAAVWMDEVERGEMLLSVRGPGTLVPEEIRFISARTEGRVEDILLQPGAPVTEDSVILVLSNPELEQAAQEAGLQLQGVRAEYHDLKIRLESQLLDQRANLARVRADYQAAILQAEADRELYEEGLIPEIQLRRSELAAEQLTVRHEIEQQRLQKTAESNEAQLAVKRAELEQREAVEALRRNQVRSLHVPATIDGVLQEVPVERGQRVTTGTTLARVAQPRKLKAELRIAETQAKDIRVGQVAVVDARNGILPGRVARIDPAVQQGTVTVDVTLDDELPQWARPDLSVDGTIEIERLADVLHVPRPAYGQADSTVGLFRVSPDGSTATRVQVKLGRSSVNTIEIVRGLEQGDQVILSDTSAWDDVDRIRLR